MKCNTEDNCSSEEGGCGCGKESCGCGSGQKGCGSNEGGCGGGSGDCGSGEGYAAMIFQAALEAKHELMVEKIKAKLEKTHGKKFDKVADLVANVLAAKWKGKQELMKAWQEFEEKLQALWEEK